jgi:tRNA G18 (ribose-2'-O)-methylase SpoU
MFILANFEKFKDELEKDINAKFFPMQIDIVLNNEKHGIRMELLEINNVKSVVCGANIESEYSIAKQRIY